MDAGPKTRQVNRQRKTPPPQPPRGAKQIVIPMTREQYDDLWHDTKRVRAFLAGWAQPMFGVARRKSLAGKGRILGLSLHHGFFALRR